MIYQLTIDDYIGRWCYSKQHVRDKLASFRGKHVDVKISSLGGDLDHGLDIRQQFIDHGDVTVYLSGFVASSATVIAMGAKRIVMSKYAMFLVHKCSNFVNAWGSYNADQMQSLIDELTANKKENDKIDVVLANMYAARCKKKVSDILEVLKEGRWLTAQEALDFGFIDEISESDEGTKLNFTPALAEKFNAIGLSTLGLVNGTPEPEPKSKGLVQKIVDSIFGTHDTPTKNNQSDSIDMKKKTFSFAAVTALLKLDSLTTDNDGDVTLSGEQLETVNNRLSSLEQTVSEKENTIKERDNEITSLKAKIEALKGAPGDETTDIEDEAGESQSLSASALFNSIKSAL